LLQISISPSQKSEQVEWCCPWHWESHVNEFPEAADSEPLRGLTFSVILVCYLFLSAAGMNIHKLLKWAADFLRQIYFYALCCQRAVMVEIAVPI